MDKPLLQPNTETITLKVPPGMKPIEYLQELERKGIIDPMSTFRIIPSDNKKD